MAGVGGKLHVPRDFRVVVTSTFQPDNYERLLGKSLPLSHLQPIQIFDSTSQRPPALAPDAMRMKGKTADGELTEDRTSLLAERRQAEDEDRENALAKVKE